MSARHTPGPFAYRKDRTITTASGTPLARCYAGRNDAANGQLFAAAPELLEALQEAVKVHGSGGYSWVALATLAIAKATGDA